MAGQAIFYLDEFKTQVGNQVRLVLGGADVINGYVLDDEFNLGITNVFENSSGSTLFSKVKGVWEGLRPTVARNAAGAEFITKAADEGLKAIGGNEMLEDVSGFIRSISQNINEVANRYYEIADDYIYLFRGSQISFPTQFNQLMLTDSLDTDIYNDMKSLVNLFMGNFVQEGGGLWGYQEPPNGYKTSMEALKESQSLPGTFTMFINGTSVRIPNLVVVDADFNISRTKVRTNAGLRPLFIEARYTVKSVGKLTRQNFLDWLK